MTILVGFVPNSYGEAAVAAAIAESQLRNLPLIVVNATKGDATVDVKYAGEAAWAELETRLSAAGVPHEMRRSMGPDIADALLAAAAEEAASLIVIGMRRRTPVGKMLMGSVAQRVLMDAPCPVLAVKP